MLSAAKYMLESKNIPAMYCSVYSFYAGHLPISKFPLDKKK